MTREDFDKLEFRFASHLGGESFHILTYRCDEIRPAIELQTCTHRDGTQKRIFLWNGKTYRTVPSLIKAINKRNESFRKP